MEKLRTPFLIAAIAIALAVVLVELGSGALLDRLSAKKTDLDRPTPGLGIRYLALMDGQVLFAALLVGGGMVVHGWVWAKIQGPATLIVWLLVLLGSIGLILRAVARLVLMVTLIVAFPFGTIVYLVMYGGFPRGAAAGTLSLLMSLKIAFAVCLLLAHQRFLQNKGLVIAVLMSMFCPMVVSSLHGLVPTVIASILDAVAAIVVGIVAAIWALLLFLGSLPSIVRAVKAA